MPEITGKNNINKPKYVQIYSTDWKMKLKDMKQYNHDNRDNYDPKSRFSYDYNIGRSIGSSNIGKELARRGENPKDIK